MTNTSDQYTNEVIRFLLESGPGDGSDNNIIRTPPTRGTSKSYTLDRLTREAPELREKVAAMEAVIAVRDGWQNVAEALELFDRMSAR